MALEAAGMVTWDWDIRSGVIRYSDNVPGIARGDATAPYSTVDGLLEMIHPDDRARAARAFKQSITEGVPFTCEYRVRMLDGAYRWILGRGKTVVVSGGRPVRSLGVSQDITERKRVEQELYERSRQLAELAAELTVAEHRQRRLLAERLHDHLQQLLVGASLQGEALLARQPPQTRPQLQAMLDVLAEALREARNITQDLAPPLGLRAALAGALRWLASDMRARHGLAVTVQADDAPDSLPEAISVLLHSAARELLLNVVKHAGTRTARLSLVRDADDVVLTVQDRGAGFDPAGLHAGAESSGFGLFSIRERSELFGGRLTIESAPGRGTRVVLTLPCTLDRRASSDSPDRS